MIEAKGKTKKRTENKEREGIKGKHDMTVREGEEREREEE